MPRTNPKITLERITTLTQAWSTLRPNRTFSGLTLEQFKGIVKPSLDTRVELEQIDSNRQATLVRRDDADGVSTDTYQRVINAIKGDPNEGEDGELYVALGYVRKTGRANGRARRGNGGEVKAPAQVVTPGQGGASEQAKTPEEVKTANGAA